jgi:hypothetical protein
VPVSLWVKLMHAGVQTDMMAMTIDTLCYFCETCLKAVSMHFAFEWTFLRSCTDMTYAWIVPVNPLHVTCDYRRVQFSVSSNPGVCWHVLVLLTQQVGHEFGSNLTRWHLLLKILGIDSYLVPTMLVSSWSVILLFPRTSSFTATTFSPVPLLYGCCHGSPS